jgi:hypothetical protein
VLGFVIVAVLPWTGLSQTMPPELPVTASFEVASVKRHSDPSAQLGIRQVTESRFSAVLTVRILIQLAYGYPNATLFTNQVVGGPSWIDNDRFDINATLVGPLGLASGAPGRAVRTEGPQRNTAAGRLRPRRQPFGRTPWPTADTRGRDLPAA